MSYQNEVAAVKALGERIGYGQMMSIASALWSISLRKSMGSDNGAFVPVLFDDVYKRYRKQQKAHRDQIIQKILDGTEPQAVHFKKHPIKPMRGGFAEEP